MERGLAILLLLALLGSADASQLSDLALSLKPGTWGQLATSNIDAVLKNTGGSSNAINPYADKMVWDTQTASGYFIGSDHGGNACTSPQSSFRVGKFSAAANAWSIQPLPPWYTCPNPTGYADAHGYHKIAIDRTRRELYRQPYGSNDIHAMNLDTGLWSSYLLGGQTCCSAIEMNAALDRLLIQNTNDGGVYTFNTATHTFGTYIAVNQSFAGTTWTTAAYNPVTQETLFFSGQGFASKMNSAGAVTPIAFPPFPIKTESASPGVVIADPVSGEWLAMAADSFAPWKSIDGIKWTSNPNVPPVNLAASGPGTYKFVVATEVPEYGVVMYTYCGEINVGCGMLLYKHGGVNGAVPNAPNNLTVQ